jgi:hypothetical protein
LLICCFLSGLSSSFAGIVLGVEFFGGS